MFEIVLGRVSEWVQNLESVTHTPENQRRKIVHSKDKKIGLKSQSAMEYLTTYGWAILILAIVLVAFFSLGVFNPYTFSPKASPGSCQILRPNSPGTTASEIGPCNNEIPQSVARLGTNSNMILANENITHGNLFTWSLWVDEVGSNTQQTPISQNGWTSIVLRSTGFGNDAFSIQPIACTPVGVAGYGGTRPPSGTWAYYAATYSGTVMTFYINGVPEATNDTFNGASGCGNVGLILGVTGAAAAGSWQFNGSIANVQVYNTSLSSGQIAYLYKEGIGGAPTNIQNLVGWWPLNGNSNDYSGNGNNGVPTNVIFTSSWESGYTAP